MEKSNKGIMILIIALLVFVLLAIVGIALYLVLVAMPKLGNGGTEDAPNYAVVTGVPQDKLYPIPVGKGGSAETMTLNLASGADGKVHYLVLEMTVRVNNTDEKGAAEVIKTAEERDYVFKDIVISVCSRLTIDDLRATDGWDVLKEELLREFNNAFQTNLFYDINLSKYNPT